MGVFLFVVTKHRVVLKRDFLQRVCGYVYCKTITNNYCL